MSIEEQRFSEEIDTLVDSDLKDTESKIKARTSKINTWKPSKSQVMVERDGKLLIAHFSKIHNYKEKMDPYKVFVIGKESYINQLDTIAAYTNFFINNYDPDNELMEAYLKIKFALDKHHLYDEENMDAYIDFLYEVIFTSTMVKKIIKLVEENYLDDIETNTEEKKKYLKNAKSHLESLEFTNQHIKILLEISFGMKIMSPALFHYIQKSHIKIEKDSDIIFRFYKRLFKIFGYGHEYELYRVTGETEDECLQENIPVEVAERLINQYKLKHVCTREEREDRWIIKGSELMDDEYCWENFIGGNVTGTESEILYLSHNKINIYNKLYVYVNYQSLSVQNLVIDLSKTSLIAGKSH